MTEQHWVSDPLILFQRPTEFVYNPVHSEVRNVNTMARFAILWSVVTYAVTRNRLVIFVGVLSLLLLSGTGGRKSYFLDTQDATYRKNCQLPSKDNPLANPQPSDIGAGTKMPACVSSNVKDKIAYALNNQEITSQVPTQSYDSNAYLMDRNFHSVPASTVPSDREAFMNVLYGGNISRTYVV